MDLVCAMPRHDLAATFDLLPCPPFSLTGRRACGGKGLVCGGCPLWGELRELTYTYPHAQFCTKTNLPLAFPQAVPSFTQDTLAVRAVPQRAVGFRAVTAKVGFSLQ
jgi:hypothetical protein